MADEVYCLRLSSEFERIAQDPPDSIGELLIAVARAASPRADVSPLQNAADPVALGMALATALAEFGRPSPEPGLGWALRFELAQAGSREHREAPARYLSNATRFAPLTAQAIETLGKVGGEPELELLLELQRRFADERGEQSEDLPKHEALWRAITAAERKICPCRN